ncbi:MAG: hypothetical protein AB8B69_16945, partial [Chitinophagales bacterium]
KIPRSFKLTQNTINQLKRLSELGGESQAKIIEFAVDLYEQSRNDHKKRFMEIYDSIGEAEQQLEYKRDTDPKTGEYQLNTGKNFLSDEENEAYEFYGETWKKMRSLDYFSEVTPTILEDE